MTAVQRTPDFIEGAVVALGLSVLAAIGYWSLIGIFNVAVSVPAQIGTLGSIYAVYLLKRSDRSAGKITIGILFIALSVLLILLPIAFAIVASILLLGIWALRCFFYRHGVADSLLDLCLSVLAVIAAVIAATTTQSVLLTVWTFFIVQALHVLIPEIGRESEAADLPEHQFDMAYENAESALRRFYATREHGFKQ